jgi:hypothetical protein
MSSGIKWGGIASVMSAALLILSAAALLSRRQGGRASRDAARRRLALRDWFGGSVKSIG